MMLQTRGGEDEVSERSRAITRYFGLGMIHENESSGTVTATGYAKSIGVATAVAEIGGGTLAEAAQKRAVRLGIDGVLNVLRFLEMLPGEPREPGQQFSAHERPHVRPTKTGYLVTYCEPEALFEGDRLGVVVKKGDLLAEVFDPYTLELIERIESPVDGVVYMARGSGPVEAGAHGYSIADSSRARWIE
jgi:predicted deacylase